MVPAGRAYFKWPADVAIDFNCSLTSVRALPPLFRVLCQAGFDHTVQRSRKRRLHCENGRRITFQDGRDRLRLAIIVDTLEQFPSALHHGMVRESRD